MPSGTFYDILRQNAILKVGTEISSSKPLLSLSNRYVSIYRDIMLHIGYDITWTEGCLLFGSKVELVKNKSQTIVGLKEELEDNKEEYSNSLANRVLNFSIQNQEIKNALKEAIAKGRQKIPNITFIVKKQI